MHGTCVLKILPVLNSYELLLDLNIFYNSMIRTQLLGLFPNKIHRGDVIC